MKIIEIRTQAELDALQRLLSKTKLNNQYGCWEFTGSKNKKGYGKFYLLSKNIDAHRASFYLLKGKLKKGKDVAHDCDNPSCINPKHLRLLSRKENSIDAVKRGRIKCSYRSKYSKLNKEKILESIRLYKIGWSFKNIANKFNVSAETIRRNIYNKEFKEFFK